MWKALPDFGFRLAEMTTSPTKIQSGGVSPYRLDLNFLWRAVASVTRRHRAYDPTRDGAGIAVVEPRPGIKPGPSLTPTQRRFSKLHKNAASLSGRIGRD
jgi:hypothetical protein